jgi:hypothetical protein
VGGVTVAISGSQIASEIKKFVGFPYVYGAAGPSTFDCSGLVQYVLTQLGVSGVPRTSEEQYAWAQKISASQLQPGDLVFMQFSGDNASPGHVGVYTGNGQVLSAEDPAQGVGYASLASLQPNIVGYGRVPGAAAGTDTATLTSATTAGMSAASLISQSAGVLQGAGTLVHDAAIAINDVLEWFKPGQGFRLAAGIIAALSVVVVIRMYQSGGMPA